MDNHPLQRGAHAVGVALHPLPILTAEANGLGCGDLHDEAITTPTGTTPGSRMWASH